MKKNPPLLQVERQNTDKSLNAERDKTNKSLAGSQFITEMHTDSAFKAERTEADQTVSESRSLSDADQDIKRDSSEFSLADELKNSEERLVQERLQSDLAIELERSLVDTALEKERELKSILASRLLEQERKLTDKNLSVERAKTDTEVSQGSILLSDEIAQHSKTKLSLTTRDEFLAIVSHDLRNPIGAAASCAEMILEDAAKNGLSPEVKHWVEFIKRNVDNSLRMISDLLDAERVAEGKMHLQLEPNDVASLIQECIENSAHVALSKSVLLLATPVNIPVKVICDHDRILQVLSNLVGNALKFTPQGGTIIVSAHTNNQEVSLSVRDTGTGIAEEKQEQIFERLAQLRTSDRTGLGLGLYISKMLIEAHHGRIWVESKLGAGSVFHFTIPLSIN
jgi:signal transduction histidine kinase